jgi:hypothetical protein
MTDFLKAHAKCADRDGGVTIQELPHGDHVFCRCGAVYEADRTLQQGLFA